MFRAVGSEKAKDKSFIGLQNGLQQDHARLRDVAATAVHNLPALKKPMANICLGFDMKMPTISGMKMSTISGEESGPPKSGRSVYDRFTTHSRATNLKFELRCHRTAPMRKKHTAEGERLDPLRLLSWPHLSSSNASLAHSNDHNEFRC